MDREAIVAAAQAAIFEFSFPGMSPFQLPVWSPSPNFRPLPVFWCDYKPKNGSRIKNTQSFRMRFQPEEVKLWVPFERAIAPADIRERDSNYLDLYALLRDGWASI
jgi:hypothetical protein